MYKELAINITGSFHSYIKTPQNVKANKLTPKPKLLLSPSLYTDTDFLNRASVFPGAGLCLARDDFIYLFIFPISGVAARY